MFLPRSLRISVIPTSGTFELFKDLHIVVSFLITQIDSVPAFEMNSLVTSDLWRYVSLFKVWYINTASDVYDLGAIGHQSH
jgi:hypothetical protein